MIQYIVQSLKTEKRLKIINKNLLILPKLKIFKSINGYDKNETLLELKKSGLKYKDIKFKTYGSLANFLTKIKILKYQIENNIEYLCFIEDDLLLKKDFENFINNSIYLLKTDINMLRLDNWGEGYVTSLSGAKDIIYKIYKYGILNNIDNQFRIWNKLREIRLHNTPWILVVKTNEGDCLKTEKFTNKEILNYLKNS